MNELYNLLEQAVENQEQVKVIVGGKAFDVKLASASHTLEPPIEVADLAPAGSIGIEVHEVKEKTMDEAKRKAIEKAVVELDGEWLNIVGKPSGLIRSTKHNSAWGEGKYDYCFSKSFDGKGYWDYICTRAEFEQVKAELKLLHSFYVMTGRSIEFNDFLRNTKILNLAKITAKDSRFNWRNTLEERPSKIKSVTQNRDGTFRADGDLQAGDMVSVGLLCKPSFEVDIDVSNLIKKQPMKYQYGVEYECKGVKPDLAGNVIVQVKNKVSERFSSPRFRCEDVIWANINSFRIIDERYKPKLDDLSAKEPTPELRELMRGDWHERGELPPVGEVVEYKTTFFTLDDLNCGTCKVIAYNRDRVWIEYEDKPNSTAVINTAVIQFSPLTTEEDELLEQARIDSENDEWLFSKRELVRRLIRKGWRPPKN